MKIISFGSCLSSNVAASLVRDFDADWMFDIGHCRSDAFLTYYVHRSQEPVPLDELRSVLQPRAEWRDDCQVILENQYPATIGLSGRHSDRRRSGLDLLSGLRTEIFDLILLDNFMDLSAYLFTWPDHPTHPNAPVFLNSGFHENRAEIEARFQAGAVLTAEQSADNWTRVISWFLTMQPTARIVFLCFPSAKIRDDPDRVERATAFHRRLRETVRAGRVRIVPPLAFSAPFSGDPDDWTHFAPGAYRCLAGHVMFQMVGATRE